MINIMLDLETMSTRPNAAIAQIGAVVFDPVNGDVGNFDSSNRERYIGREFKKNVSLDSVVDKGFHLDGATIEFWMKQSESARNSLLSLPTPQPLPLVLQSFVTWIEGMFIGTHSKIGDIRMWANCAAFDNVILRTAFTACHISPPWMFRNDRSYRTLKNLYSNIKFVEPAVKHDALEDARAQAAHALKILNTPINGPLWQYMK